MKYLTNNHKLILGFIVFLAVAIGYGCTKDDTPATATLDNMETLIKKDADLTLFDYAMQKVRLNVFMEGQGPFTIFAPTNQAMTDAGLGSTAAIDAMDSTSLAYALGYHIQPLLRTYTEIPVGPNATMSSQTGLTQYASRNTTGAYINGILLLDKGTSASNGIYYKVGRVLMTPTLNVLTILRSISDFKLMAQAISKTNDTAAYISSTVTLFALNNSIMTANGYDSTTIANLTGTSLTTLSNIIKYNTISGLRIYSPDFKTSPYVTRFSSTNKIAVTAGSPVNVKGTSNPSAFQILGGNANCTNGVIHVLSGMLKP